MRRGACAVADQSFAARTIASLGAHRGVDAEAARRLPHEHVGGDVILDQAAPHEEAQHAALNGSFGALDVLCAQPSHLVEAERAVVGLAEQPVDDDEMKVEAIDSLTEAIIGDAIEVHRELGPGLLESTYEACLAALLLRRGLQVKRQVTMPLTFRGESIDCGYRLDLLVERRVVVELKTVAKLEPVHMAQMMTYLKLSGCIVGLLINFNATRLTDGIRRVVRGYRGPTSASSAASAALCD